MDACILQKLDRVVSVGLLNSGNDFWCVSTKVN
jgi:heptaprenylglyceryl phosphate synthase